MACEEAGKHRNHDLFSPSASKYGMDEPCLTSQTTVLSDAGGDVDAPPSSAHAISLGVIGGANSHMRLSSPVTPPFVQDRKAGTVGKGRCLGGLQIDVDYREISNCCRVAPLSPIAEEGGATPTYVTTPVEPVATPVLPVLSLQKHTHILKIGVDETVPPLPVVTDKAIWLPTWPESHHVDVNSSRPSVIDVPDFFYQNLACTECVFQNGYRTQNSFRQRHDRDDVVDARGCQPRFAPLFVFFVSKVRQKWCLMHEDVKPRFRHALRF